MSKNRKVPVAVLSCFLIAFVLQGILKLNGVFVFEKTLDWDIFKLIDSAMWSKIVYYSIIMFSTLYFLSFALTKRWYSKKWYHYVILVCMAFGTVSLRLLKTDISYAIQNLIDILIYVTVPLSIYFTTNVEDRMLGKDVFGVIVAIALQIMIYFIYLGLTYWSALLTSLLLIEPIYIASSASFLIEFEIHVGLLVLMLSLNMLVDYIKGEKI